MGQRCFAEDFLIEDHPRRSTFGGKRLSGSTGCGVRRKVDIEDEACPLDEVGRLTCPALIGLRSAERDRSE